MNEHDERDFHMEEFRLLKGEVMYYVENCYRALWVTVLAVAAVYHSMLSGSCFIVHNLELVRWLPVAMSVVGAIVALSSMLFVQEYGKYFCRLEAAYGRKDLCWDSSRQRAMTLGFSLMAFWLLLIVGNIFLASHLELPADAALSCRREP